MSSEILLSKRVKLTAAAVALAALMAAAPAMTARADADAAPAPDIDALVAEARVEDGAMIARICGNCHSFTPGGGNKVGPNLYDVVGRRIAGAPGYPYSSALAGKAGETWSNGALNDFLADPNTWAPGTRMSFAGLKDARERAAIIAWLRALPDEQARSDALPGGASAAAEPVIDRASWRLVREGLVIDLSVTPVGAEAGSDAPVMQGVHSKVAFRITNEATGEPVPGLFPGAWMDLAKPWGSDEESSVTCKERAGLYLQGQGFKPLVDMNSYFMLVLNRDPTILVFDPLVNVSGKTMLYAQINLRQPGADWVKSRDDRWYFVSMPRANQVAVIDTNNFKVSRNIDAGVHPVRVAVQPDGKYLWVGNDSKEPAESGVTVIDVESLDIVAQIPTGAGHHEIAFSDDSRSAYVSNRSDGTVSVIDVQSLEKRHDIATGPRPISLAFSPLSKALYVADAQTGVVSVIDATQRTPTSRIEAMRGLGPLRFDASGRWAFVVNPEQDLVHVIDASANRIAHDIAVGTRPYQIGFSRSFAYVRSLGTERVSMINLQELEKGRKPPVVTFPAGDKAPEKAPELNLADGLVEAPGEAAVLVASPADATVYYYMEGMNAPMGAFRNYGHRPLAVGVVDRALREEEPGVYVADVPLPSAGTYEIALIMDAPQILHCFRLVARPNPAIEPDRKPLAVEYLVEGREVPAGKPFTLRFQLTDPTTGRLKSGLGDVRVLFYRAPGQLRTEVEAREVRDGLYEATLPIKFRGAYYVHVATPSMKVLYGDLPYLTLLGVPGKAAKQGARPGQG